ncbi:unnamed protein product, partial [Symbiodinium sp. CCMP2456]
VDEDDVDPQPWTTSEFEMQTEKINTPGSPGIITTSVTTCAPSTCMGSETPDADFLDTSPEPSPPSKSSKSSNFFCSSFDSRIIRADLPENVPRAPNGRTHQLYVQYLDQYLQEMQGDQRGFRFAVLRRRRRDFLGDSFQSRCASLLPKMSRHRGARSSTQSRADE